MVMLSPELVQLFKHPPRAFGPTPLWWWSGARVTRQRLEWQMRRFARGGIHNLVVINLAPAGPIFEAQADDPAWFSEEWWARFVDTCEVARELDLKIWFYDQIGFSGANIQGAITHRHPSAAGRSIRSRWTTPSAGRQPLAIGETLIGAYTESGERLSVRAGRVVDAPTARDLRLVTSVPSAFDYLDQQAVSLLIDAVHREYDRRVPDFLGTTIAGSFQDELPGTNSWTPRFADEFLARRGYDLLDHLPALWVPGDDGDAKVRGDYYAVRAELTEEALFRPLGEWHQERGMLIGCDQSNPARAGYPTQSTQIYTDYFRTHRWYGAAGSDHEGDAKVHSSMAHLYDHERVWIEAFHSSGWGATLEDTYDWLLPFLRSGANLYNPHASYFGTAAGWFEWAPPSTDWRQPYWRQYPAFSRAIARIASIMSWGDYSADVAVLYPTATAQATLTLDLPVDHFGSGTIGGDFAEADRAQNDWLDLCGRNNWFETRLGALDSAGISFDVIDDDSLRREPVRDAVITVGGLRYRAVILPSLAVLEEATARQLSALLDQGGRVLAVGAEPRFAAGRAGDDSAVRRLREHPRLEHYLDAGSACAALADLAGHARSDLPLLVRRRGEHAVALVTAAFPNATAHPLRTNGSWLWHDYDFDPARYAAERIVTVEAVVGEAEMWDPATGERRAVAVQIHDGTSRITVPLGGAPAVLLVWREGEGDDPDPSSDRSVAAVGSDRDHSDRVDVSTGWTGELVPTMDNTWADLAPPVGSDLDRLSVWSMQWREDDGDWQTAKATYGNRLAVHEPVAAGSLRPLSPEEVRAVMTGSLPLAPADWPRRLYSSSRGIAKPGHGALGNKGRVPEEFVQVRAPAEGEIAIVRGIVETDHTGRLELIVAAGAAKRVWWNGHELSVDDGYLAVASVRLDRPVNVLEYHLGTSENGLPNASPSTEPTLSSYFALARPGTFGARPTFMKVGPGLVPDGCVTYRNDINVTSTATRATLIVGAASGLTVSLDGALITRQEKVEYYESLWGATPAFFSHDVTGLMTPGVHTVQIIADSSDARDVVYADLVVRGEDEVCVLTSGAGWRVETAGRPGATLEHRGHWGELASAHAANRSHPLAAADWLNGSVVVGEPTLAVRVSDRLTPAVQCYRITLPAGTVQASLPIALSAVATLEGVPVPLDAGSVTFADPLPEPATLEIATEATTFLRGGSAWAGPCLVTAVAAPITLGDWSSIGLRSWSGGVTYRRTVTIADGVEAAILDLGRVRGSVELRVDGQLVGERFCVPYRFELPGARGEVEVAVTVYNTLAPFLDESTPTAWTFPSQHVSGLFGPVLLITRG
jgi:alpha-L-rhamnosidase